MTTAPVAYRMCTRCVMDTSDPAIEFDDQGRCNHCTSYDEQIKLFVSTDAERHERLDRLVRRIQAAGKGKPYDCVIGLSGGVDSSYLAFYVVRELHLRPLAVHLDNGWNSNLAVSNIERIVRQLDIDLYTEVLDWEEFRDLQVSFLRASTPDSEIPTDHAITAILMQQAARNGVKFILGGSNVRSEGIMPVAWSQGMRDLRYIEAVQKQFGSVELDTFPRFSILEFAYRKVRGQRWIHLLDYIDYRKADAVEILQRELGWEPYPAKHGESVYTRFFQNYILPRKFGYDKRRGHLASLVCAGELSRHDALDQLAKPIAPESDMEQDREFVAKKLGLSLTEFDEIMALPRKTMFDYPNYETVWWHRVMRWVYRLPRAIKSMRHR